HNYTRDILESICGLRKATDIQNFARTGGAKDRYLLYRIGLGFHVTSIITSTLGRDPISQIKKNPEVLLSIKGIGYKMFKQVISGIEIPLDNPAIISIVISHVMSDYTESNGSTYISDTELINLAQKEI